MTPIQQKILKAINNGRLSLVWWEKKRYNYILQIQKLYTDRNNRDWYDIYVYDHDMNHLDTLDLYNKPFVNSGCVWSEIVLWKFY